MCHKINTSETRMLRGLRVLKKLSSSPLCKCQRAHRLRMTQAQASNKRNETPEQRAARKEHVKQEKAQKRARRQGEVEEGYGSKDCSLCHSSKDLLIRPVLLKLALLLLWAATCTYVP